MRFRAVIFDLFGTLVDIPREDHLRSLRQMAGVLGAPFEDFKRIWTKDIYRDRQLGILPDTEAAIRYICGRLGVEPDQSSIDAAVRIRLDYTRRCLVPRADVVPTLRRLKDQGLRLGLISDCSPEVPVIWGEMPLASLVDIPVFSPTVHLKKPDPRIYTLACDGLGVAPSDCLYVGDGDSRELTGAAGMGMTPVRIRVPHELVHPARSDEDTWRERTISSLSEVLPIVFGE